MHSASATTCGSTALAMPVTPAGSGPSGSETTHSGWRRAWLWLWRLAGVVAIGWALVAARSQLDDAVSALRSADPAALAMAVACQLAALALLSLCYRAALATAGADVPLRRAAGVAVRAGTISRALPGGGAAAAVFAVHRLRRAGVDEGRAIAGVVVNGVVTMTALAAVVAVLAGSLADAASTWMVGVTAVLAVLTLRSNVVRRRLRAVTTRRPGHPSLGVLANAVDALATGPLRVKALFTAATCAGGAWALEVTALWLAAVGVATPLPVGAVALGLGAAHAAAAVPHTPGGVGVVEMAMTGVFVASGVDTAPALGAVLAYRAVGFWFPVALGAGLLIGDRLGPTRWHAGPPVNR